MGRFFGDRFIESFNRMRMVRAGGAIAGAGLFLLVLIPQTLTAIIGFACVGMGLSVMIPIAFSGAGNMPGIAPGRGVASVATLGYSGFLLGPPLIGFVARYSSLRVSMALVGCLAFLLVYLAKAVRPTIPTETTNLEYEPAIVA
jgi:fucose permease